MNKADFEHCYGRSCFLENEENDDLKKVIQNHKQAIQKVYFKNQTLRWVTSTVNIAGKQYEKKMERREGQE